MRRVDLASAHWTIEACGDRSHVPSSARGRAFPARVPGCVHSDLIRAGVIGHPNLAFHEEESQWIGRTDWRYRCRFEVDAEMLAHDRVDLVLDGLDTIATIDVNGEKAGHAMNMHHAHRFSVKPLLCIGGNEITIELRGPVSYVEEQEARLGKRPVNGDWTPYCYMRKMASNFQWDWGPRVATCGIWRGARLEGWNAARFRSVQPIVVTASADTAKVQVRLDLEDAGNTAASWDFAEVAICPVPRGRGRPGIRWQKDIILAGALKGGACSTTFELPRPALWWPRGHGEQPLYALQATLNRGRVELDERRFEIGLLQARLLTPHDGAGSAFALEVNGVPIFCKGANWIPEGLFPEDQSPQRIRQRVKQAADANMNMLRVWGGGTHEQDAFYDACDEMGILVWQDFMFACATFPEDDPYPQLIEREAREAVTRLCHHPSIVLWCGGNENVLGYESWGWKQRMPREQKWGERYFFEILPRVVKELDPSRPYWPDSPHSSETRMALHSNDPNHGDRHTWDAKVEGYRDLVPRFCSEFGHQSPPCWVTMRDTWGEDQLHLDSRAMTHRQRATGGNEVWYGEQVLGHRFARSARPHDFDEWLYLAHLLQARAMSIGIEWLRANRPRCMGALFWQLNDAWAGHSWSCIDSAGRRKPAWYAIRRSFAPRLLTIQPFEGAIHVCAVNDEAEPWEPRVRVRRMAMDGATLAEHVERIVALPRAVGRSRAIGEMVGRPIDERGEFIVAEADGVDRAYWFFRHDRELSLPPPRVDGSVAAGAEGAITLTLRADTLLRDVVIAVDRVDASVEIDDNLITLLPGESRTLRIAGGSTAQTPAARWIAPPVFRCANEFSAARA